MMKNLPTSASVVRELAVMHMKILAWIALSGLAFADSGCSTPDSTGQSLKPVVMPAPSNRPFKDHHGGRTKEGPGRMTED